MNHIKANEIFTVIPYLIKGLSMGWLLIKLIFEAMNMFTIFTKLRKIPN
jgi:hypothetical protein